MNDCYDEQAVQNNQSIMKYFSNERLILSMKISKYNEWNFKQERTIVMSTKRIFNFKGVTVKRTIEITNILAISFNTANKDEFIIHVQNEYDYRLSTPSLYCQYFQKKLAVFFFKEESLKKYTTYKSHMKKGQSRIPEMNYKYVDIESWDRYLDHLDKKQVFNRDHYQLLFSKDNDFDSKLDDFEVINVIGKGSLSNIYLVQKKTKKYALKILSINEILENNTKSIDQIKQEIKDFKQLNFTTKLEYCWISQKNIYLIIKFYQQGDLFHHLRNNRNFAEIKAKRLISSIVFGINEFHRLQIIYRDLKPENIMINQKGQPVLIDLGVGRFVQYQLQQDHIKGTPEYIAPEILAGKVGYTVQSDYWQIGILLYEILFGIPPFYNQNINIMIQLIQESDLFFPNELDVSIECINFIQLLLNKDPQKRPQDYQQIISHKWLQDVNWDIIQNNKLIIFDITKTEQNQTDFLQNFDQDIIRENTLAFWYE